MLGEMDRRTRVVLTGGGEASDEMAAYLPRLSQVLRDAAEENANLSVEIR